MKIEEIIPLVNDSIETTSDKSELKLKKQLLSIFNELLAKDLTKKQINLLNKKLYSSFSEDDFKTINKKDLKKRIDELMQFLNNKLFLFSEGHYGGIGLFFGAIFGLIFQTFSLIYVNGSVFNLYSGFIFMFVGIAFGAIADSQIKKQGRSLKTRQY